MMQRTTVEPRTVVYEIVCDRCDREVQRDGSDFESMTSIGFRAGYASIFGDGNRVEIDLCPPCLRDTLGTWLRVTTPEDTPLARRLDNFKPEIHGGEFPVMEVRNPEGWADRAGSVAKRSSVVIDDTLGAAHASDGRVAATETRPSDTPHRKRIVATLSIGSFDMRPIEACVRWRLQFDWAGESGNEPVAYFLDEQKNESFRLHLDGAAAHLLASDERVDMLPFVVAGFCKAMFGSTAPPVPEPRDMSWSHAELTIVEFGEALFSKELIQVALQRQHGGMHVGWRRANDSMQVRWRSATDGDQDPVVAVMNECLELAAEKELRF